MIHVTLDFETYFDSDYSLRKLSNEAYIRDPRFQVLGVGVKVEASPTVFLDEQSFREWAARVDWAQVCLTAHHAQFDGFVLNHHFNIRPGFWICTMSQARARGHTSVALAALGPAYGLGEKGDGLRNVEGKRYEDLTDEDWDDLRIYCCQDTDLTHGLRVKMQPGFPASEYRLIDLTVRQTTEPALVGDVALLERTLAEDQQKKADMLARSKVDADTLRSAEKFAALLVSKGVDPPTKDSPSVKVTNPDGTTRPARIYAFAQKDAGMAALLEHPQEDVRHLAQARLSAASNIVESRTQALIEISRRGPIPVYLKYSGAHTNRWSGGDGINLQNLPRGSALRDALMAPPGHVLVAADSGQIEARVVAWLAGETTTLEIFRRNDKLGDEGDFYSDVGSMFYGKKLSKKETPDERQNSKSMVLGLGFSMGDFTFGVNLLKGFMGAKPVQFTSADAAKYGVDVSEYASYAEDQIGPDGKSKLQRIKEAPLRVDLRARLVHFAVTNYFVRKYRKANPKIEKLWRTMDDMLGAMARGETKKLGCLTFGPGWALKPSGLRLYYPELRRAKKGRGFSYWAGRKREGIYGGLLTENLVQSLARDVVAGQALKIRERYRRIPTTTHDEIVACVPETQGEEARAFMLETMRTPPPWCADLPLNASGGVATRYGQAK